MGPKSSSGSGPSKKTEAKAKAKVIEDKTFGLKNKNKSTKVSKYVAQVEAQVKGTGSRKAMKEEEAKAMARRLKKEEEERKKEEASLLGKPVIIQPKVPFGADPKSVLCAYFKAGQCTKGDSCKYSHDLNVDRKSSKIDVFSDMRDQNHNDARPSDTMESWDQSTLETVVLKKHGPGVRTTTEIVCKYFIDAIEQRKYGWFWECPNGGGSCKYRHALPPGFILKMPNASSSSDKDTAEETISLEEFLEQERHKLGDNVTKITGETFSKWKEDRKRRQSEEALSRAKKKEAEIKAGKTLASGRDLFTANPQLFEMHAEDEDDALDADLLMTREDLDEEDISDPSLFLAQDIDTLNVEDEDGDNKFN